MKNENYLNLLVKYAERLISNNVPVIFDMEHFCLLTEVSKETLIETTDNIDSFYDKFLIPKKNKTFRNIEAPKAQLKQLQRVILHNILNKVNVSPHCHGFKKGSSIITNALLHTGKKVVYNLDLEDFFPSINQSRIYRIFVRIQ